MAINYKLVTATSDASSPDTVFTATAVATHVKSIRIANESGGALTYHLAVYDHSTSTEVLLTVPATSLPDDDVDLMVEPINLQNGDYIKLYSSGAGVKVALTLAENTDVAGATTSDDLAEGTTNLYLTSAERTKLSGIATGAEVNQNAFSNIAVSGQTTVAADAKTDTFTLVAGTGVTLTTDAGADSITIAASSSSSNSFETIAVAGQSSVVADSATDTLTLVAGTGITITTDAGADSVTITNSATGANAFGNVAVSGQTTVAADSTNDTLTLAAANSNVVLTTDATTDTVTVGLGTDLVVGSLTAATGNLTTLANVSCVDVTSSGSANLTNAVISTSLTVTSISFTGGGTTTLGPNNTLPTDPSDFLIRSNGNVDIVLDYDDDESSQAFRVKDGDNNTMFSVDEDGISVANGTSSTGAVIRLGEATANGTNYVGIQAPASLAANTTWILPSADGTNAQVLQTNGSGTLSFASLPSAPNTFGTIAVSGQSNVVADSSTDTLTLVAGTNVTITTDAITDSITIAATGGGSTSPAGSNGQIQYNASGSFGAEAALYYDATNNRLSVGGDTSPGATLEVRGAGTTTGVAFNLENSSGTERFKVLDNGRVAITEHSILPAFGPTLSLTGTKADYYTASITLRHTSFTTSMTHVLDSNTCAVFAPGDYVTGGLAGEGTTSNSAGATPFFFAGYHGSASPTSAAVRFQGGKNNGSNSRTSIGAAEPVLQLNNWSTITLISLGSGGVGIRNSAPTSTTTLTVRGQGTSTNECLRIENSSGTARLTVRDDGGYAFAGGTVGLAQTGYTTFTNLTTDRTCDANATTVEELADILGTLIVDLKTKGIISA